MTALDPSLGAITLDHLPRTPEAFVFQGVERGFERVGVPGLDLAPGEVLVEVELATICGSDRHTVAGDRHEDVPLVLGHEQVGRVVAVGPGQAPLCLDGDELAPGDRVVWAVAVRCGNCSRCRNGLGNKCEHLVKYGHSRIRRGWELSGGLATHVHLVAGTDIVRVPEHIPAEVLAPASCATATVAAAIDAVRRPLSGELVVVSGCGMLGLTAIAMARSLGATVIGVDPDRRRRREAIEFGATETSKPGVAGLRSVIGELTRLGHTSPSSPGFGVGLEMSGSNQAISDLLTLAGVGASVVLVGSVFSAPPVEVSAEQIVRKLLTISGVHNYTPDHLVRAVHFLARADHARFASLVSRTVRFEDVPHALVEHPGDAVRVGVRP